MVKRNHQRRCRGPNYQNKETDHGRSVQESHPKSIEPNNTIKNWQWRYWWISLEKEGLHNIVKHCQRTVLKREVPKHDIAYYHDKMCLVSDLMKDLGQRNMIWHAKDWVLTRIKKPTITLLETARPKERIKAGKTTWNLPQGFNLYLFKTNK